MMVARFTTPPSLADLEFLADRAMATLPPTPSSAAVSALAPPVPKASVECTTAHFFLPSVVEP